MVSNRFIFQNVFFNENFHLLNALLILNFYI